MNDTSTSQRRLALVIDADNAQPSLIQPVLLAAASRGRVTVRRIYGDWTSPNMTSWKAHLLDHSIRPIQQFRIVGGKNATDSAMIIDAMDLLHSGLVDGFCIVSSDSDFTSLARRIQESGLFVMGVGRRTTPVAFQRACEEFVFTDDMRAAPSATSSSAKRRPAERTASASPAGAAPARVEAPRKARSTQPDAQVLDLLSQGIRSATDEDTGWAGIGRVGQIVRQYEPGFSNKDYGHASLSGLLESHPELFRLRKGEEIKEGGRVLVDVFQPGDRVDVIGISILSGAHMALVPRILELLKANAQEHVKLFVGGIIPEEDVPRLLEMGVVGVYGPGALSETYIADIRKAVLGSAA